MKKYFNTEKHISPLRKHAKEKHQNRNNISACDPPVTAQQSADERICNITETSKKARMREKSNARGKLRFLFQSSADLLEISDKFRFSSNFVLCFS